MSSPSRHRAEVIERRALGVGHAYLRLRVGTVLRAEAGQFVQILCRDPGATSGGRPYLRRPFSLAGLRREGEGSVLDIVCRVVGEGSAWLDARREGNEVDLLGPLGKGFSVDRSCTRALLVAGGCGHAPLLMLGEQLAQAKIARLAFCGARKAELLPLSWETGRCVVAGIEPTESAREWKDSSTPLIVSTEDGSAGFRGTVVEALEAYMAAGAVDRAGFTVYGCGPVGMLEAVAARASRWGMRCQVALETLMGCGMGTCQSCVVRVRAADAPEGWRYRLCCADGPVFEGDEIIW